MSEKQNENENFSSDAGETEAGGVSKRRRQEATHGREHTGGRAARDDVGRDGVVVAVAFAADYGTTPPANKSNLRATPPPPHNKLVA